MMKKFHITKGNADEIGLYCEISGMGVDIGVYQGPPLFLEVFKEFKLSGKEDIKDLIDAINYSIDWVSGG